MRSKLKSIGSEDRHTFTGTFKRTGWKSGYRGDVQTVLLLNVKDSKGNVVTSHLWFNLTRGFESANPMEGDIIQFDARVDSYYKGYMGYREDVYKPIEKDYKLSRPTKVVNLTHPERMLKLKPVEKHKAKHKEKVDNGPTESQLELIHKMVKELGQDMPELDTKLEASKWIGHNMDDYYHSKQHKAYTERRNQAKSLFEQGKSCAEIADEMDLSVSTIRKYKREW